MRRKEMNTLRTRLRDFKLAGIYANIEERLSYAKEKSLSYAEFLELLMEDEANSRKDHSYKKRYSKAKFPAYKTIEEFDFSFHSNSRDSSQRPTVADYVVGEKKVLANF